MAKHEKTLEELVLTRILHLNAKVQGAVTGIVAGLAIFAATNWLILKGGPVGPDGDLIVGPHLSLLGQFFVGYRVTFVGSLIGFAYAFALGFVGGYSIAIIYNWFVNIREGNRQSLR